MHKYFWQRWHNKRGRVNALNRLKALAWQVRKTDYSAGAWRAAKYPAMHYALNNERLKRWGLWVPSDFVTR